MASHEALEGGGAGNEVPPTPAPTMEDRASLLNYVGNPFRGGTTDERRGLLVNEGQNTEGEGNLAQRTRRRIGLINQRVREMPPRRKALLFSSIAVGALLVVAAIVGVVTATRRRLGSEGEGDSAGRSSLGVRNHRHHGREGADDESHDVTSRSHTSRDKTQQPDDDSPSSSSGHHRTSSSSSDSSSGKKKKSKGGAPGNVGMSSPTSPNPTYHEPGCPRFHTPPPGKRILQIKNNCDVPIWPGVLPPGAAIPPEHNWEWKPGDCKTMELASALPAFRVWARTHCDEEFNCVTGSCIHDGTGGCAGAGETPCSLWEATLQDHCTAEPSVGVGPDFYDQSLVDGYNLPIGVRVSGGYNVGLMPEDYSCKHPVANAFNPEDCPFELRVYSDQIKGTNLPVEGLNGKNMVTSKCFTTPTAEGCVDKVVGCRSVCKAMDQGWIGYYIDHVEGDLETVNPMLTRPNGDRIRWSEQFLQGKEKCGETLCKDVPAWGAFRGDVYASGGKMKNLVCCDLGFRCSPFQINNVPGGCPYQQACPTLGAGDPYSRFHNKRDHDLKWPQADQELRMSSHNPDWPMPTRGGNYAKIYKDSSPEAYSWQFNDASSTYTCCGKAGQPGPSYIVTFCP